MQRRKVFRKKKKCKGKQKRMKKPVDIDKRPVWDSCSQDMSKYKLSRMEYVLSFNKHLILYTKAAEEGNQNLEEPTKSQGRMVEALGKASKWSH